MVAIQTAEDAVRLYNEKWSIRQIPARRQGSYGVMHRILRKRVTFRNRGGTYADILGDNRPSAGLRQPAHQPTA